MNITFLVSSYKMLKILLFLPLKHILQKELMALKPEYIYTRVFQALNKESHYITELH